MNARFAIPSPCHKRWSELPGEDRKRFCPDCKTYVHALEQYTAEETLQLKKEAGGKLCGYLAGGPPPLPQSRRVVLVGALLTAISPLMAQSGRARIRVTDASGAVVPFADVSLVDKDGRPLRTARAGADGEVVLADLPMGVIHFTVSMAGGFGRSLGTATVQNGDEVNVTAQVYFGAVGTVITVGTVIEAQRTAEPPGEDVNAMPLPYKTTPVPLPVPADPSAQTSATRKRKRWWIFR